MIKLSKASGRYPQGLVLEGLDVEKDAVAGGGFGDVHKGKLHSQTIAVKILRVYQKSDMVKLMKVFFHRRVAYNIY